MAWDNRQWQNIATASAYNFSLPQHPAAAAACCHLHAQRARQQRDTARARAATGRQGRGVVTRAAACILGVTFLQITLRIGHIGVTRRRGLYLFSFNLGVCTVLPASCLPFSLGPNVVPLPFLLPTRAFLELSASWRVSPTLYVLRTWFWASSALPVISIIFSVAICSLYSFIKHTTYQFAQNGRRSISLW